MSGKPSNVTEQMVTQAIYSLVYTGYNDEAQIRVIRRQASCREYVRAALEAALAGTGLGGKCYECDGDLSVYCPICNSK